MPSPALTVAIFSLVVACVALGWQIASWLLTAGRAKLVLVHGAVSQNASYTGEVGRDGRPKSLRAIWSQGLANREVLGVTVRNTGRLPLVIVRYELHTHPGDVSLTPVADAMGPTLPHKLDPGYSATWHVGMDDVRRLVATNREVRGKHATKVFMKVETGLGKSVRTRRKLRHGF